MIRALVLASLLAAPFSLAACGDRPHPTVQFRELATTHGRVWVALAVMEGDAGSQRYFVVAEVEELGGKVPAIRFDGESGLFVDVGDATAALRGGVSVVSPGGRLTEVDVRAPESTEDTGEVLSVVDVALGDPKR